MKKIESIDLLEEGMFYIDSVELDEIFLTISGSWQPLDSDKEIPATIFVTLEKEYSDVNDAIDSEWGDYIIRIDSKELSK